MPRHFLPWLISTLAAGCSSSPSPPPLLPVTPQVIKSVFGGSENHEIVQKAESVTACRLKVKTETLPSGDFDYEEGPFVAISSEQAIRFRQLLDSPSSYAFEIAKGCSPVFGVRLRFASPDDPVDIDLCFQCDILSAKRKGEYVGGEDFDAIRPQLVAICKQLFPGDSEIQGLNPNN